MFNVNEHKDNGPDGLPPGLYDLVIEEAQSKVSSTNYKMASLKIRVKGEIRTGGFKNALQWENLCYGHASEPVARIAKAKLAEICAAVGIESLETTPDGDIDLTPLIGASVFGEGRVAATSGRRYVIYTAPFPVTTQAIGNTTPAQRAPQQSPPPPIDNDFDDDIPF